MDESRFDDLVRRVATSRSRRSLLKAVGLPPSVALDSPVSGAWPPLRARAIMAPPATTPFFDETFTIAI